MVVLFEIFHRSQAHSTICCLVIGDECEASSTSILFDGKLPRSLIDADHCARELSSFSRLNRSHCHCQQDHKADCYGEPAPHGFRCVSVPITHGHLHPHPLAIVIPPSIVNVPPVTQAASSDAKYNTIFATSSGVPGRRIAYCARIGWSMSGLAISGAAIGVSIKPGFTTLQRIPSVA